MVPLSVRKPFWDTLRENGVCIAFFHLSCAAKSLYSISCYGTSCCFQHRASSLHNLLTHSVCICSFHRCCPLIKASFYSALLHPCDPQLCSFCMSLLSETDKRDLCGFLLMNWWSASVVLNKTKYNILWVPSTKDHWFGYWKYGLILSFFVQKSSLRFTTL